MRYKLLIIIASIYIFGVFSFALYYYKIFGDNTSNLIINSEYNEYVIGFSDLWSNDFVKLYSPKTVPIELDLFNDILEPYYDSLVINKNIEKVYNTEITALENNLHVLDSIRYEYHDINVNKANDSINANLYRQRDTLIHKINELGPDSILIQNYKYNENQLEIARLKVKLSELEIEITKNDYLIANSVVNDFGQYDNKIIVDSIGNLYDKKLRLQENIQLSSSQNVDIHSSISRLSQEFHHNRYEKVRYIDVLYFSFTTSVASTYGDIIPNNRKIRIATMIQLAMSILLIGIIVGDITNRLTK